MRVHIDNKGYVIVTNCASIVVADPKERLLVRRGLFGGVRRVRVDDIDDVEKYAIPVPPGFRRFWWGSIITFDGNQRAAVHLHQVVPIGGYVDVYHGIEITPCYHAVALSRIHKVDGSPDTIK